LTLSSFGITWPSNLGRCTFGKRIVPLTRSQLAVPYVAYLYENLCVVNLWVVNCISRHRIAQCCAWLFVIQILSRCPACFHNFVSLFCRSTCDPRQSEFLAAITVTMSDKQKKAISEVTYAVSEEFGVGMFNSCRDVQNPSSGKRALDMLCGKGADKCTPENWLQYMGDKSLNPVVPFTINFDLTSNSTFIPGPNVTLHPMRSHIEPCNESCSCQDCRSKCSPLPPDVPPHHWTILGYDPVCFIVTCCYAAFVLVFGLSQIWTYLYCSKDESSQYIVNGDSDTVSLVSSSAKSAVCCGSCDRLQAKFEHSLEAVFAAWGRLCARHFSIVIVTSVLACIVLIFGVTMFEVVTDPVELWSSPHSRARIEKNYFDNNFG